MTKDNKSFYVILAVVSLEPMSGYDIKKYIEGSVSNFWNISYGQIYPTLNRLVEIGYVTYDVEKNGNRPERKVYCITENGISTLKEWLVAPVEEGNPYGSELLLKLFFGSNISIEDNINHVIRFRNQQSVYLENLNSIRDRLEAYKEKDRNMEYQIITVRQGQIHAQSKIEWCEETINRLTEIKKYKGVEK